MLTGSDMNGIPRELEPEIAVLGAIILEPDAIVSVSAILIPEDFNIPRNRVIYESMLELYDSEGQPIDLMTLGKHLERRKQLEYVGISYLSSLANTVPTAANVEYYAQMVLSDSLERKTRAEMVRISSDGELTAEEMTQQAQDLAGEIAARSASNKGGLKPLKQALINVFEQIEHSYLNPNGGNVTGIPTGYPDLDKMTSGLHRGDYIVVGARPSVGKTAFALNIASSAGESTGESIAVFSLEMGIESLAKRMISAKGNVDASRMRTGRLESSDWENVTMAIGKLSEANIFIDDSPSLNVNEIRARCRQLKKETGSLGLILIDYLQLIAGVGRTENRQQEIAKISRTLKQIARELDVPVIALSQLSRGVEQRQDKRPMMSDLRESGSIEQDADIVAFLYRDDYYDKESEKKNIIEIIIAKQRNGPVGTVELAFLKNYNKFVDLDRSHHESQQPKQPEKKRQNPERRRWA
ncbi:replicative DNA helicase [Paenibacillus sp. A3]|uniref:replicative DNA helicase n=1 Tax=Paenibacillus sp. A3 TaxID=1337054 RepID=UPI0006D549F0|nr:replicative DNA helicase [Paenibacillus sp. A3]